MLRLFIFQITIRRLTHKIRLCPRTCTWLHHRSQGKRVSMQSPEWTDRRVRCRHDLVTCRHRPTRKIKSLQKRWSADNKWAYLKFVRWVSGTKPTELTAADKMCYLYCGERFMFLLLWGSRYTRLLISMRVVIQGLKRIVLSCFGRGYLRLISFSRRVTKLKNLEERHSPVGNKIKEVGIPSYNREITN